jgi:hypothetical protein
VLEKPNRERASYVSLNVSCCICDYINMRHRGTREVMRYTAVSHHSPFGDHDRLELSLHHSRPWNPSYDMAESARSTTGDIAVTEAFSGLVTRLNFSFRKTIHVKLVERNDLHRHPAVPEVLWARPTVHTQQSAGGRRARTV